MASRTKCEQEASRPPGLPLPLLILGRPIFETPRRANHTATGIYTLYGKSERQSGNNYKVSMTTYDKVTVHSNAEDLNPVLAGLSRSRVNVMATRCEGVLKDRAFDRNVHRVFSAGKVVETTRPPTTALHGLHPHAHTLRVLDFLSFSAMGKARKCTAHHSDGPPLRTSTLSCVSFATMQFALGPLGHWLAARRRPKPQHGVEIVSINRKTKTRTVAWTASKMAMGLPLSLVKGLMDYGGRVSHPTDLDQSTVKLRTRARTPYQPGSAACRHARICTPVWYFASMPSQSQPRQRNAGATTGDGEHAGDPTADRMGVRRGRRIPSIRRRRRWARRCAARSAAPVDLAAAQVEVLPSAGEQGRGKPEERMRDGRAAMGGDVGGGSGGR
uniref:Uncharacterized protein n=1 Tax=Oryza glumipatula TaxID=40148 RepID=A0A0D9Z3L2_9ORYZ